MFEADHHRWFKTTNPGSIQLDTCVQGTYLPLFRRLPSGSLRGLRRIYILLGVNRSAKWAPHSKRTSKNVEGVKSRRGCRKLWTICPVRLFPNSCLILSIRTGVSVDDSSFSPTPIRWRQILSPRSTLFMAAVTNEATSAEIALANDTSASRRPTLPAWQGPAFPPE